MKRSPSRGYVVHGDHCRSIARRRRLSGPSRRLPLPSSGDCFVFFFENYRLHRFPVVYLVFVRVSLLVSDGFIGRQFCGKNNVIHSFVHFFRNGKYKYFIIIYSTNIKVAFEIKKYILNHY